MRRTMGNTTDASQMLLFPLDLAQDVDKASNLPASQVAAGSFQSGLYSTAYMRGKSYSQTSTSGGTSIVDCTDLTLASLVDYGAMFEVVAQGCTNLSGSGQYRSQCVYHVYVQGSHDGVNVVQTITQIKISEYSRAPGIHPLLTLTAVFWNGTSEVTDTTSALSASVYIRLKLSGYVNNTGSLQTVCVRRIM